MTALPAKNTDAGAETRLLLAECRGPSFPGYNLAMAKQCMQLMDLVLRNRIKNPRPFLSKAGTLLSIITAPRQFQGFRNYPNYDAGIMHNIQEMVDIANNPRDHRATVFAEFIQMAIRIALGRSITDPTPGALSAWRTAGSGSPGPNFILFKTVLGTSFYYVRSQTS